MSRFCHIWFEQTSILTVPRTILCLRVLIEDLFQSLTKRWAKCTRPLKTFVLDLLSILYVIEGVFQSCKDLLHWIIDQCLSRLDGFLKKTFRNRVVFVAPFWVENPKFCFSVNRHRSFGPRNGCSSSQRKNFSTLPKVYLFLQVCKLGFQSLSH